MSERLDLLMLPAAARAPHHIVGWREGKAVTHAQWLKDVAAWRDALAAQAAAKVVLYIEDSLTFAGALFAAWQAGKTVVLPPDDLPATRAALAGVAGVWAADLPDAPGSSAFGGHEPAFAPLDPAFVGVVVFTSGSTGVPQAIPKRLSQLAAEVATLEALFGARAGQAEVVATVSHQHIYGLLFKVLWPLAAGRAVHAASLAYPEQLACVSTGRECILVSSPAHLKRLPGSPAWTAGRHRIRISFSSGGPLDADAARMSCTLLGAAPVEVYGSSETGGIGWRQRNPGVGDHWSAMPGVEMRADADGSAQIRSAHLPDREWCDLADRVQLNGDGRFLLQGRSDRIVKIEEKRVSLDRIESLLAETPLVSSARTMVAPGRRESIAAFVVLTGHGREYLARAGKLALNRALRALLADTVERVALPRRWRYLDALPVDAQGKTTRAALLALLEQAPPTQPHWRLVGHTATRAELTMQAGPDLLYFDGHFPGAPILPGVVQVEWAVRFARAHFCLPPSFEGIQGLKFQRVIRPSMDFTLVLECDPGQSSVSFKYHSGQGPHASGRLLFGAGNV